MKKTGPIILELAGPAGAGKTTLSRALSQSNEHIVVGADIALRRTRYTPVFVQNAVSLLPVFLWLCPDSRWFRWDEIKSMVYLKGWARVFREQAVNDRTCLVLDQGPVYRLAQLHALGPDRLRKPGLARWWNDMFTQWASTLDLVIWLDAPDSILETRINARDQRHMVKGRPEPEVSAFLTRYRSSYELVFEQLAAHGGPAVVRFDTGQSRAEEIIDSILAVCAKGGRT